MAAKDFTITLKGATAGVAVVAIAFQPDGSAKMQVTGAVADSKGVGHQLSPAQVDLPANSKLMMDLKAFALVSLRKHNGLEDESKKKGK